MIWLQIFIGVCFGVPAAFSFAVGCYGIFASLKISHNQVEGSSHDAGDKMVSYAVVGLGALMISGIIVFFATKIIGLIS